MTPRDLLAWGLSLLAVLLALLQAADWNDWRDVAVALDTRARDWCRIRVGCSLAWSVGMEASFFGGAGLEGWYVTAVDHRHATLLLERTRWRTS